MNLLTRRVTFLQYTIVSRSVEEGSQFLSTSPTNPKFTLVRQRQFFSIEEKFAVLILTVEMIVTFDIPSTVVDVIQLSILIIILTLAAYAIQRRIPAAKTPAADRQILETVETIVTSEISILKGSATTYEAKSDSTLLKQSAIRRNHSYRMEEELPKKSSSEYTRRGQLWSKHASWNLPKAPRSHRTMFRYPVQGLEHVTVSYD